MAIKDELRQEIIKELEGRGEGAYLSFVPKAIADVKNALHLPCIQLSGIIRILEHNEGDDMEIINLLFNAQENFYENGLVLPPKRRNVERTPPA